MVIKIHETRVCEFAISKHETLVPVGLCDDDQVILERGWYWMKGSRDYPKLPKHCFDRPLQGAYWYMLATKAGRRFARKYVQHNVRWFVLSNRFLEKINSHVRVVGRVEKALIERFRSGFLSVLWEHGFSFESLQKHDIFYLDRCWMGATYIAVDDGSLDRSSSCMLMRLHGDLL